MTNQESPQEKTREVATKRDMFSLRDMRAEMDRLWDAMTSRSPFLTSVTRFQQPAIDVFEKDGGLHVRAEVPGMTDKDLDIEVTEDSLTISGEKKEEKEVKEENYYRSERSYGKFTRRIPLPRTADSEKATAKFKDGVLEIDMPLTNGHGARKLEINP
jgi:HSP20 family protein